MYINLCKSTWVVKCIYVYKRMHLWHPHKCNVWNQWRIPPPPPSLIWGSWSAPGNNLQWIIFQIIFRISSQVGKFWSQVDLLTRTNSLVCICQVLYGRKAFLVCKDSQKFKQTTLCKMKIIINIKCYYW